MRTNTLILTLALSVPAFAALNLHAQAPGVRPRDREGMRPPTSGLAVSLKKR